MIRFTITATISLIVTVSLIVFSPRAHSDEILVKKNVVYSKTAETELTLDLVLPQESAKEKQPLIVFIHGGGWHKGSSTSGINRLKQLVSDGYIGASINYRFSNAAKFPAQIQDCEKALSFLRKNADKYNIDSDKVGVWGNSAGGHLASLLGTSYGTNAWSDTSDPHHKPIQAVCNWYGPTDFSMVANVRKFPKKTYGIKVLEQLIGGHIEDNKAKLLSASPHTYISKEDPPFLIMHGKKDKLVPAFQNQKFTSQLQEAGVSVDLHLYDNVGHGGAFFWSGESIKVVKNFFNKTLKN